MCIRDRIYKHNIKDKFQNFYGTDYPFEVEFVANAGNQEWFTHKWTQIHTCLLYTSDAADERSSVDLGGRRIIKKKKNTDDAQNTDSRNIIHITR